jgi:hypothetical protein
VTNPFVPRRARVTRARSTLHNVQKWTNPL